MSRRRFGPEEETAVLAAYAEQPSVARAAAVAGVGATWAYNVLRRAGVVRQTLVFPASLAVEARKIYLEQNLSCREVAAILASRLAPASGPSQQWVCDRMREAGVLRDKSQANRIRESRRNRRDYAALAERASELYRQGLSTKEIARRLQVTHGAVGRWVDQRRESLSRVMLRHYWQAPTAAVATRRRLRVEVLRHRVEGRTYSEIQRATGLSRATVYTYLRAAGLTGKGHS